MTKRVSSDDTTGTPPKRTRLLGGGDVDDGNDIRTSKSVEDKSQPVGGVQTQAIIQNSTSNTAAANVPPTALVTPTTSPIAALSQAYHHKAIRNSTGRPFLDDHLSDNYIQADFKNFWRCSTLTWTNTAPHGIQRPGMLCYRNAVLTALLNSPNLTYYIKNWFIPQESDQFSHNNIHVLTWLHQLREFATNRYKRPEFQAKIRENWKYIGFPKNYSQSLLESGPWVDNPRFEPGSGSPQDQQQDAEAFLQWLFETVSQQMDSDSSIFPRNHWQWVTNAQLVSHTFCRECNRDGIERKVGWMRSDTVAEESCISLRIPTNWKEPRDPRVSDLLLRSLKSRLQLNCKVCGKQAAKEALQDREFQHAPPVLAMRIERGMSFSSTLKNITNIKLDRTLDISQLLNPHQYGNGSRITYKLTAVVVHEGKTLQHGHYFCYVRTGPNDNDYWTVVNDDQGQVPDNMHGGSPEFAEVKPKNPDDTITPYILIYDRDFANDIIVPGRQPHNVKDWDMQKQNTPGTMSTQQPLVNGAISSIPQVTGGNILSQEEINRLVSAFQAPPLDTTVTPINPGSIHEALKGLADGMKAQKPVGVASTDKDKAVTDAVKAGVQHQDVNKQKTSKDSSGAVQPVVTDDTPSNPAKSEDTATSVTVVTTASAGVSSTDDQVKADDNGSLVPKNTNVAASIPVTDHAVTIPTATKDVLAATAPASTAPVASTVTTTSQAARSIQVPGLSEDGSHPPAKVELELTIDNLAIPVIHFVINNFDPKKYRNVEVKATLVAHKIQTAAQAKKNPSPAREQLDLVEATSNPAKTDKAWKSKFQPQTSASTDTSATPAPPAAPISTRRVTRSATAAGVKAKKDNADQKGRKKPGPNNAPKKNGKKK